MYVALVPQASRDAALSIGRETMGS